MKIKTTTVNEYVARNRALFTEEELKQRKLDYQRDVREIMEEVGMLEKKPVSVERMSFGCCCDDIHFTVDPSIHPLYEEDEI